jgi:hypothetical protein
VDDLSMPWWAEARDNTSNQNEKNKRKTKTSSRGGHQISTTNFHGACCLAGWLAAGWIPGYPEYHSPELPKCHSKQCPSTIINLQRLLNPVSAASAHIPSSSLTSSFV